VIDNVIFCSFISAYVCGSGGRFVGTNWGGVDSDHMGQSRHNTGLEWMVFVSL
jgi:hypothetical protein